MRNFLNFLLCSISIIPPTIRGTPICVHSINLEYGYLIINESFIVACAFLSFSTPAVSESVAIDNVNESLPVTDTVLTESVSLFAETGMMAKLPAIAIQIVLDNASAETKRENFMLLPFRVIIVDKKPIILKILPKYILGILLLEQK